jgi:hypothetical protein
VSLTMAHELKDNRQVAAYTCYNSFKIEIAYKFDYKFIFFLEYVRNAYFLIVLIKKSNLIICEFLSTQKGIKGKQTKTQKEIEEKHDSFGCSTDGS